MSPSTFIFIKKNKIDNAVGGDGKKAREGADREAGRELIEGLTAMAVMKKKKVSVMRSLLYLYIR